MYVHTHQVSETSQFQLPASTPSWALVYFVEDFDCRAFAREFRQRFPQTPLFGASSFRGVFTPAGLIRGAAVLYAEPSDGIPAASAARATGRRGAREQARGAAEDLRSQLGEATLSTVLMHATPGSEEAILQGIADAVGPGVAVYGGSAADEQLAGRWSVFAGEQHFGEGLVLAGFAPTPRDDGRESGRLHGGFLDGYLPTNKSGIVTQASGRVIGEIDGRAAALVYNDWTGGIVSDELATGGNVLTKTNLYPLGRVVKGRSGLPRRLLSHPHEVTRSGELSLFTTVAQGDRVELMIGTAEPLIHRIDKVVSRAVPRLGSTQLKGGVLIYCGGCLAALEGREDEVAKRFADAVGQVPFIGAATFGEQGALAGPKNQNHHGNLMCSTLLFD